jgi:preprotein translocase subunit SecA
MRMKAELLPIPGIVTGAYPERRPESATPARIVRAKPIELSRSAGSYYRRFVEEVEALDAAMGTLDRDAVDTRLKATRAAMARHGLTDALVAEAFVFIKRTCARELGITLFPTQLLAARVMLDKRLAEMATGEGKTLAAGVCAAAAALAGIPVHVITANDYLVTRDAAFLQRLYAALGLRVATVTQSLASEQRRAAYDADIVYCTASEVVFDYLRDGLARGGARSDLQRRVTTLHAGGVAARPTLLRGLCMAIVDEADSILIDEARVPLILSERCSNGSERRYLGDALALASGLVEGSDFDLRRRTMSVELTGHGRAELERLAEGLEGAWRNRLHREETVCTALAALHLYARDRHYLVRDGKVAIVDESTGRLAHGRVWSRGLHQLIELKEACEPSADAMTVAQITYQRFFQRYLALAGMSGTLAESNRELLSVYGLPVVRIPLGHPDRRTMLPTRLFPDAESRWRAAVAEAVRVSRSGRPVLIGTDSVAESEALSRRLAKENVEHAVLNASQDGAEAEVIARAGERGRITVATNMAGRGTDIALGAGIAGLGGLHVLCCQHNATQRIDRQLVGRGARRGDPGSAQFLLALDHPLIGRFVPQWLARRAGADGIERPQWLIRLLVRASQHVEESRERGQRRALLEHDRRTEKDGIQRDRR